MLILGQLPEAPLWAVLPNREPLCNFASSTMVGYGMLNKIAIVYIYIFKQMLLSKAIYTLFESMSKDNMHTTPPSDSAKKHTVAMCLSRTKLSKYKGLYCHRCLQDPHLGSHEECFGIFFEVQTAYFYPYPYFKNYWFLRARFVKETMKEVQYL